MLYDADVLSEEAILSWADEKEHVSVTYTYCNVHMLAKALCHTSTMCSDVKHSAHHTQLAISCAWFTIVWSLTNIHYLGCSLCNCDVQADEDEKVYLKKVWLRADKCNPYCLGYWLLWSVSAHLLAHIMNSHENKHTNLTKCALSLGLLIIDDSRSAYTALVLPFSAC